MARKLNIKSLSKEEIALIEAKRAEERAIAKTAKQTEKRAKSDERLLKEREKL